MIAARTAAVSTTAFRNGSNGAQFADFDQSVQQITSFDQGSSRGLYTVRGGETLASIAAALWGDGSLWYVLAEANGRTHTPSAVLFVGA